MGPVSKSLNLEGNKEIYQERKGNWDWTGSGIEKKQSFFCIAPSNVVLVKCITAWVKFEQCPGYSKKWAYPLRAAWIPLSQLEKLCVCVCVFVCVCARAHTHAQFIYLFAFFFFFALWRRNWNYLNIKVLWASKTMLDGEIAAYPSYHG